MINIGSLSIKNLKVGETQVKKVYSGSGLIWEQTGPAPQWEGLTIKSLGGNSITYTPSSVTTADYSLDGINWNLFDNETVELQDGQELYIRGEISANQQSTYANISASGNGLLKLSGNINSLITKDGWEDISEFTYDHVFYKLFQNNTKISDCSELLLPATILTSYCYSWMFYNCSSLTLAPALPAGILADSCYFNMFKSCSSLSSAPELPATTLAEGCYSNMFNGCSSLSSAPELPATTLANSCYYYMFSGCTNLISGPSELPATTLESYCYEYMFSGCSSLTSAPEILATLRKTDCMRMMFYNCSLLNYVKTYIVNWSTSDMQSWLFGTAATGTVECPTGSTIPTNTVHGVPTGWTKVEFSESGSETDDDDDDPPFGPPGGGPITPII